MKLSFIPITAYLSQKGAGNIPHANGTLLDHLRRVSSVIEKWGLDGDTQKAALCHSIYSTSHFKKRLVGEDAREEVKLLLGDKAEQIVFYFSILDRDSLKAGAGTYTFTDRNSGKTIEITGSEFQSLLHILLANQLDHSTAHAAEAVIAECNAFTVFREYLAPEAWSTLVSLGARTELADQGSYVRFIGHAGVWVKTPTVSVAIDPWLYSSNLASPIIEGTQVPQRTIDYLIPRPVFTTKDISPDIVILSHLHTHHSPYREFASFAAIKKIHVVCAPLSPTEQDYLKERMGLEVFNNISFHFCASDTTLEIQGVTIRALSHTQPEHFAYLVTTNGASLAHIADGRPGRATDPASVDPVWNKFAGMHPDFLFISASNHSQRIMKDGVRDILEHQTFSPVQAAKLARSIQPKNVGLVGMYNFSIWDSLVEYTHASQDIENEFAWALSYLAPSIKLHTLRPGTYFPFGH